MSLMEIDEKIGDGLECLYIFSLCMSVKLHDLLQRENEIWSYVITINEYIQHVFDKKHVIFSRTHKQHVVILDWGTT